MKSVAAFLLCRSASAVLRDTSSYSFEEYLSEFGKSYSGDELHLRRELFSAQLAKVNKHNQEYLEGKHTWFAAMNEYSDWAEHEQARIKTGKAAHDVHAHPVAQLGAQAESNPSRKDWREEGVVTPVKNQGGCGSCWAFSATEVVESHHAIQNNLQTPLTLAPQAYVNCVQNPQECGGSGGCEGATMELAFNMTRDLGLPLESDLPYEGRDASCSSYQAAVKVNGYVKLPVNDAKALETALATVGPVSVTVAANWFAYGGGVYSGGCSSSEFPNCDLDHGVVAVGYDQDYWLVRNSWGSSWGEQGYIRLSRKNDAVISTDRTPADGVACKPYPESQQVAGESGILFDTSYPTGVVSANVVV